MKKILFIPLLFNLFLGTSIFAQEKNNIRLNYPIEANSIRKVETNLLQGIVTIQGNREQEASVEITAYPFTNRGQSLSKEEIQTLLDECFEVGVNTENGTLFVTAKQIKGLPKTYKWWQFWEATRYPADNALGFSITIKLGANADIDIKTKSGSILVQNINGIIALQSGFGYIKVDDCSGEMTLHTESGRVILTQLSGSVEARSGFGAISADSCIGNMSLRTESGNISLDNSSGGLIAHTDFGHVRVAMTDVTSDVKLSGNHGIQLSLPPKGYNLQVSARLIQGVDGLKDFNGVVKPQKIEGAILGGGNNIYIKTKDKVKIIFE